MAAYSSGKVGALSWGRRRHPEEAQAHTELGDSWREQLNWLAASGQLPGPRPCLSLQPRGEDGSFWKGGFRGGGGEQSADGPHAGRSTACCHLGRVRRESPVLCAWADERDLPLTRGGVMGSRASGAAAAAHPLHGHHAEGPDSCLPAPGRLPTLVAPGQQRPRWVPFPQKRGHRSHPGPSDPPPGTPRWSGAGPAGPGTRTPWLALHYEVPPP